MVLLQILAGDGDFWRDRHEKILAGNDPRERCHCGKIAHIFSGGAAYCSGAHMPKLDDGGLF